MTKDVIISVCSEQYTPEGIKADESNTVMQGLYYEKNRMRYILYDEAMEGVKEPVKTRIKFDAKTVELVRSGPVNIRMLLEKNKTNMTSYRTPYGNIMLGINTGEISVADEDGIILKAAYLLENEGRVISRNKITITVKSAG